MCDVTDLCVLAHYVCPASQNYSRVSCCTSLHQSYAVKEVSHNPVDHEVTRGQLVYTLSGPVCRLEKRRGPGAL